MLKKLWLKLTGQCSCSACHLTSLDDDVVGPGHPLHEMLMDAMHSKSMVQYSFNHRTGKLEKMNEQEAD